MRKLLAFLEGCGVRRRSVAALAALQLAVSALTILLSQILKMGIDSIQFADRSLLGTVGTLALGTTVLLVGFGAAYKIYYIRLQNAGELHLQARLMDRLVSIKKRGLDALSSGKVLTIVVNNASKGVQQSLSSLEALFSGSFTIVLGAAYMLALEWRLAACLLLYLLLLRALLGSLRREQRRRSREAVAVEKENSSFLVDLLQNMMTVRLFEKNGFFLKRLRTKERALLRANMKRNCLSNGVADGTWAFVKLSEFFLIYGVGAYFIHLGMTTAGVLIAFTFAVDVVMKGMDALSASQSDRAQAQAQIESVAELLENQSLEDEPEARLGKAPFAVRARGVSFGYTDEPVLRDVDFTILPGEKVLLQGQNGKGKSTLLKLIAGLYRPTAGEIDFGEQNACAVHLKSLSQVYAYIAQESNILAGGMCENIALSREYDAEKAGGVIGALGLARARENDPMSLSQGEKQRVNIGRCLYRGDRPLILGDEIFSNVDADNAARILSLLAERFRDRTIILVSHDPLALPFDRVLTVENGTVLQEVRR